MNFDLLRFRHFTLPICEENSVKTSSQNQKQQNWAKGISPWRANGELKGEHFQRAPGCFATEMAMARNLAMVS